MPGYYHNSMEHNEDEEARYPLFRSDSEDSSKVAAKNAGKTSNSNRVMVIIALVLIAFMSIYFQVSQGNLTDQLGQDEQMIKKMKTTIDKQELVIARFNSSVTNTDVIHRLSLLEEKLATSSKALQDELDATMEEMNQKLKQTMLNLEATVDNAEQEINDSVQQVKTDYEEFQRKTNDQFSMENSFMIWQLAGTFTLLSCLISMWHMSAHLRELNQPIIQRKILAILWMCPIYAITSWFSLVFPATEGYLAIIKDSYEAYIIYQFLSFCISVIGKGEHENVVDLLAKRADHLPPPVSIQSFCACCCGAVEFESDHAKARAVLLQCQVFAMQFVFWRPVTTIAKVLLKKYEYYGPFGAEGPDDWRAPQMYIFLIQNISIFTAFTGLLKFYHLVDEDLAWCRPFAKFLCIKGVVFMTFWQGLAISVLGETMNETGGDPEQWAAKSQNFLICLEMLIFSLAHYYCFPVDEWKEGYKVNYQKLQLGDSIALGDFFSDLKLVMTKSGSKKKKKTKGKKLALQDTVQEGDEENGDDGTEGYDSDDQTDDASVNTTSTVDNPEFKEAKRRLSKFLDGVTDEAAAAAAEMDNNDSPNDNNLAASPGVMGRFSKGLKPSSFGSSSGSPDEEPLKPKPSTTPINNDGDQGEPNETTSLLSPDMKSPLKPSIFTTVADIAEQSVASADADGEKSADGSVMEA
eukprot:CAMPEP_0113645456 /NCGR_PEP_ID=MMETSP0017_2-20120614/23964_1 /TAXON_ID=2856 /ORGANISM="Cylindrotheca closterium" /LENGTH=690 /DNA_ID=CAMNT_0000557201 /DNA_START=283 /DNA_END=2355 /DNA_ORIENTATION=+ /assembly_acc=CAM_ASM_000147